MLQGLTPMGKSGSARSSPVPRWLLNSVDDRLALHLMIWLVGSAASRRSVMATVTLPQTSLLDIYPAQSVAYNRL